MGDPSHRRNVCLFVWRHFEGGDHHGIHGVVKSPNRGCLDSYDAAITSSIHQLRRCAENSSSTRHVALASARINREIF